MGPNPEKVGGQRAGAWRERGQEGGGPEGGRPKISRVFSLSRRESRRPPRLAQNDPREAETRTLCGIRP